MKGNVIDDRVERELRRRRLAARLIAHQARTQTIEELTGLTRHQLATVRRRGAVPKEARFRGPPPTSFEVFFTSARARSEGAVLALLYCAMGAAAVPRNGASDPMVERGERLCDVYELWHHYFPRSSIEFEQLRLLGEGITRGEHITFGYCGSCHAIILVDRLAAQRRICGYCARPPRDEDSEVSDSPEVREDEELDLGLYGLQVIGGQLLREGKGGYKLEEIASQVSR